MIVRIAACAAAAALAATPALAADAAIAQLGAVKGSVLVNAKASNGAALKAGDRVVAAKGAASVKFADGCTVSLKAGSMLTVGAKSPCASGAGVVSATSAQAAQGEGMLGLGSDGALILATTAVVVASALVTSDAHDDSTSP